MAVTKRDCQCIECERCLSLLSLALAAEEWHGGRITDAQLHEAVETYATDWIRRKGRRKAVTQ